MTQTPNPPRSPGAAVLGPMLPMILNVVKGMIPPAAVEEMLSEAKKYASAAATVAALAEDSNARLVRIEQKLDQVLLDREMREMRRASVGESMQLALEALNRAAVDFPNVTNALAAMDRATQDAFGSSGEDASPAPLVETPDSSGAESEAGSMSDEVSEGILGGHTSHPAGTTSGQPGA